VARVERRGKSARKELGTPEKKRVTTRYRQPAARYQQAIGRPGRLCARGRHSCLESENGRASGGLARRARAQMKRESEEKRWLAGRQHADAQHMAAERHRARRGTVSTHH
jgi:hypothetical protein